MIKLSYPSSRSWALRSLAGAAIILCVYLGVDRHGSMLAQTASTGWSQVPAILSRIKAPTFASRDFKITDYGAVADGKTDNTEAIRTAVAACNAAGGGRVVVTPGVFLTGAVHLKSNVNQPYRSRNILIEDVTINNSPMWEIDPVLCTNVTVRGVTVVSHGPNNDGCNPESRRDVLIEECVFDTGDDCIAIKSGRNDDGRRIATPSENIIVRNCVMKDGHGGVVMGSEISGGVRNVFVENCKMDSTNLDRALRFNSNAKRGGVIENVFMRNVEVGRVAEAILTIDFLYLDCNPLSAVSTGGVP